MKTETPRNALTSLRRFMKASAGLERCELCAANLAAQHAHLLELSNRRLVCACEACGILFSGEGAGRYRRVPRRNELLRDFHLTDVAWESLQLPIDLAFFVSSASRDRVLALYPSPGGATEAVVPAEAWQMLVEDNPLLLTFEPDVEALLVNRLREKRESYRIGIDHCFRLVGLVRTHWRGLSGGSMVWNEIDTFFSALKERCPVMVDLNFRVDGVSVERHAAVPLLQFKLLASESVLPGLEPTSVHAVVLRCQIRIEPARRRYEAGERDRLFDLFDRPERWGQTLRPLLWTHVSAGLPAFRGSCAVDLAVPCSYDFNLAATKYFAALETGDIPLCFLFSGSIFYQSAEGGLQVGQISWEKEAYFKLPAATWREMMDHYHPGSVWLSVNKDVFAALEQYRRRAGLTNADEALHRLLAGVEETVTP